MKKNFYLKSIIDIESSIKDAIQNLLNATENLDRHHLNFFVKGKINRDLHYDRLIGSFESEAFAMSECYVYRKIAQYIGLYLMKYHDVTATNLESFVLHRNALRAV